MQTIPVTWKDGGFVPTVPVDLAEGTEGEIHIADPAPTESERKDRPFPLPDPPFMSECQPAPFDLPMPPGEVVKAIDSDVLLPEPHDIPD